MEILEKDSGEMNSVPVEDVGIVVVENQRTTFSIPVLNALADNNSTVILCDKSTKPNSILLPLEGNSVQSEILKTQAKASVPLKKQLWKQLVTAKIRNQASMLDIAGKDGSVLKPYYSNVKSGDSDNREGVAAKMYWNSIFGEDFMRDASGSDGLNAMLNYGYTILRSAMCRAIVGSGLSLSYGLFHKSRYNAFPLADDLMEPYRPYVDCAVYDILRQGITGLERESKISLLKVLTCDTNFGENMRPLEIGLSYTTASLVKCLNGEIKALSLPCL